MRWVYWLLHRVTHLHAFKRAGYEAYLRSLRRRGITVGERSQILHCTFSTTAKGDRFEIGRNCTLTGVALIAHDASPTLFLKELQMKADLTAPGSRRSYRKKITIGDNVFVGWGTIILPGVTIGDNVVIGAGSVVTGDISPGSVACGNPARVIGTLDAYLAKYRRRLTEESQNF